METDNDKSKETAKHYGGVLKFDVEQLYDDILQEFPPPFPNNNINGKARILAIVFNWYIQSSLDYNPDNFAIDLEMMLTEFEGKNPETGEDTTLMDYLCSKGLVSTMAIQEYYYEVVIEGRHALIIARKDTSHGYVVQGTLIHLIKYLKDKEVTSAGFNIEAIVDTFGDTAYTYVKYLMEGQDIKQYDKVPV